MIVEKTVETVYAPLNETVKEAVLYKAILAKGDVYRRGGEFRRESRRSKKTKTRRKDERNIENQRKAEGNGVV